MELTLKVPDELKARLRSREAQLVEILKLGLEVIEGRSPTPEELVAYSRHELDEEAHNALAERLAVDEEAVNDLLDFERFEDLEPPSEEHRLSDGDVARALAALRGRIVAEGVDGTTPPVAEATVRARPTVEPVTEAGSETNVVPMPSAGRSAYRVTSAWLALAASLLVFLGIWSAGWRDGEPAAVHSHPVRLGTARSLTDAYMVPVAAETIQLILAPADLPAGVRGRLVITKGTDRVVFEQSITGVEDSESKLFVTLASERLPSGRYRVEVFDVKTHERVSDTVTFTIERTLPGEDSPGERSPE